MLKAKEEELVKQERLLKKRNVCGGETRQDKDWRVVLTVLKVRSIQVGRRLRR